jgi:hypothetical protein
MRARRLHQGLDLTAIWHRGQMFTFNVHWQAGEECASWMNLITDECRLVGLCYGQA